MAVRGENRRATDPWLDALARLCATRPSRRGALRALAGAALGGALVRAGFESSRAQARCDVDSLVFSDSFESGDLSAWDNPQGIFAARVVVYNGKYAGRAAGIDDQPRFARTGLGGSYDALYFRVMFNPMYIPTGTPINLLTFRTADDRPLLGLGLDTRSLTYRNDVANDPRITGPEVRGTMQVTLDTWHEVQVYVRIAGTESSVRVWLDGIPEVSMANTEDLGTEPIGRIQIGESLSGRMFDVAFDEIGVATRCCGACPQRPPACPPQGRPESDVCLKNRPVDCQTDDDCCEWWICRGGICEITDS